MRFRVALVLGVLLAVTVGSPALADDLSDRLTRSDAAEYTGELFISCATPDGPVSQLLDVVRSDGRLWVSIPGTGDEIFAGDGTLYERGRDGTVEATRVSSGRPWQMSSRYTVGVEGVTTDLGRAAEIVTIREGDLDRVSLHFDVDTGALVRSEVRNGDGSVYCSSAFVAFVPGHVAVNGAFDGVAPTETSPIDPSTVDPKILPEAIERFQRLDVYAGPEGSTVAYYSDGVFSFTVFTSDRPMRIPELDGVPEVDVNGQRYIRHFRPGEVVYAWETRYGGYALIGDLPMDLQETVLGELPAPRRLGFFGRLWRNLFG